MTYLSENEIVRGCFKRMDTHGVPLSVQVYEAHKRSMGVSLPEFYQDALRAGWKPSKALAVVEEAMVDNGAERVYVEKALDFLRSLS